jgi:hypothetical protein
MVVKLRRYLWLSQAALFVLLVTCTVISPKVAFRNGGVSNFGNQASTVVFYSLSFVLSAVFLYLAAELLLRLKGYRHVARILKAIALLELLVLVSTYPRHLRIGYEYLHDVLGVGLFFYQFALAVWLVRRQRQAAAFILILCQAAGALVGLLSLFKVIHLLFIGQIVGALSFGVLLVTVLPRIVARDLSSSKS